MAPSITANGPQIDTLAQVTSDLLNGTTTTQGFFQIYGPNINVGSNSPDGQMINIFAVSKIDMENFGVAIYQSMDTDEGVGIALDNDGAFSGNLRQGGTYTQVVVQVQVNQSLNLNGLDLVYGTTPFTIQDTNGNQYNLITSIALTSGTYNLNFQAANIGVIQVLPNTITTPVTIIAGVVSVNNSAAPYQNGTNQETDAQYRLRLQASTASPAVGPLGALYGQLNKISGVQAKVYENNTGSIVNGIPANGIWVVVNGGTAAQIANAIYIGRTLGCPMKGSQSYVITQVNGQNITIQWDNVIIQQLYVQGTLTSLNGQSINISAIVSYLIANWIFGIYQLADITTLDTLIKQANPNVVATGLGVSTNGVYFQSYVEPTSQQYMFQLQTANINL